LARACIHVMNLTKNIYELNTKPTCGHINVGVASDLSIRELAQSIKETVGYVGKIEFDLNKPEGTPAKLLNSQRINSLGWFPETNLKNGLNKTYKDFLKLI